MNVFPSGEALIRYICGSFLWMVSAILTIGLFLSFAAGDVGRAVVLVLLAVGLEGAKILTWRSGGVRRVLSWVLICLSILASFGSALQTVRLIDQSSKAAGALTRAENLHRQVQLDELDRQIRDLSSRLEALPPTWLSWYQNLSKDLKSLREERLAILSQAEKSPVHVQETAETPSVFQELADFTGWNRAVMELVILLVMAICLEWGALALLVMDGPPKVRALSRRKPYDPNLTDQFLSAMVTLGSGDYLGGRDRVAKSLGLSQSEAKWHFQRLVDQGRIKKSGERMIIC